MNRFQHDNIDPHLTPSQREQAMRPKGINRFMSDKRRAAKQERNRKNRAGRK